MVQSEGLYDRGYLVIFDTGETLVYRNSIRYTRSVYDVYHIIKDTDTLYTIARQYYGSSSLWFMIPDVNDNIEDIFDLTPGDTILIPNVPSIQSTYVRP